MNTDPKPQMRAITRLTDEAGLTVPQIAEAIHVTRQAITHYRAFDRFPTGNAYKGLVNLALERGIVLLASDFLPSRSA